MLEFPLFVQLLHRVLCRTVVFHFVRPMGPGLFLRGIFEYWGLLGENIHLYSWGFPFPFSGFQVFKFKPELFTCIKKIISTGWLLFGGSYSLRRAVFVAGCPCLSCVTGDGLSCVMVIVACVSAL